MTTPAQAAHQPAEEGPDGVFPALLAGIQEFRARIEGTDDESQGDFRTRILRGADEEGFIHDAIETVLKTLKDIFAWLYETIDKVDDHIVMTDVIFALVELLGTSVRALGETVSSVPDDGPLQAIGKVGGVISTVGRVVENAPIFTLPKIIPTPSTLQSINEEIVHLLGPLGDAEPDPNAGSLTQLILTFSPAP